VLKRNAGIFTFLAAVGDSLCALAAWAVAVQVVAVRDEALSLADAFRQNIWYLASFVVIWCWAATDQRLFVSRRDDTLTNELWSVLKAAAFALILSGFLVGFFTRRFDQSFLVVFSVGVLAALTGFRAATRLFLRAIRRRGYNYREVLIVGANERSQRLLDTLRHHADYGYSVAGVVDDEPERVAALADVPPRYLGTCADLERILSHEVIDEVFITLPVRSCYEDIKNTAYRCEGIGVRVHLIADLFPVRLARSHFHLMDDVPLLSLTTVPENHLQLAAKRSFDFVVSSALLVALAPLFLAVAAIIKLDGGPVFFLQERVGLNQRRFKIFKFRSMVVNAEELLRELQAKNEADGPVFKMKRDPRITSIGRFIRKYSIDELPQLINVWLGDMSLVGPRPPIPSEVEEYTWEQRRRLSVKPGMTGLWQVSGRSEVNFEDWVSMDLAYIDQWSLLQDFRILVKTVQVVLQGKGAA
jgi:exopolysaccharide biosynthesis polyprenyl glycosylphosphotransferase